MIPLSGTAFAQTSKSYVPNFNFSFENYQNQTINFAIEPGNSVKDTILLKNRSSEEDLHLKLYSTDSIKTNQGDLGYKLRGNIQNHIGQWITFEQEEYYLEPNQIIEIPYIISIPSYASPGLYAGGILAEMIPPEKSTGQITVISRKAKPIFIDVEGEKIIDYQLHEFNHINGKQASLFQLKVGNTGTTFLKSDAIIEIEGSFLSEPVILDLNHPVVLQNDVYQEIIEWKNRPLFGSFTATLNFTIYDYDIANDRLTKIDTIRETIKFQIIPTDLILLALLILFVISCTVTLHYYQHKYLIANCKNYTVKKGDSLKKLAENTGISWRKLAKINNLKAPFSIKTGQKLKIPKK